MGKRGLCVDDFREIIEKIDEVPSHCRLVRVLGVAHHPGIQSTMQTVLASRDTFGRHVLSALVATVLGCSGPAIASAVAAPPPSPATPAGESTTELTALLNVRAGEILTHMRVSQAAGTALIREGHGLATRTQFVAGWKERREVFQKLHQDNIDALKRHDLALSREITTEIDLLLYDNEKFLFSATQENRAMHFEVFFDQPDQLAKTTYPGAIPQSFSKSSAQQAALIAQPPTGQAGGHDPYEEPARKLKALLK
jgi:hypothetical protein